MLMTLMLPVTMMPLIIITMVIMLVCCCRRCHCSRRSSCRYCRDRSPRGFSINDAALGRARAPSTAGPLRESVLAVAALDRPLLRAPPLLPRLKNHQQKENFMTDITSIPLNKLIASEDNVRDTPAAHRNGGLRNRGTQLAHSYGIKLRYSG